MLYNLRVRWNFLIIVNDNGMGKKAGKSLWSDNVHVHGVREYGAIAQAKGLSVIDGAFFCLWKCLEDWDNLDYEEQKEFPDLPTRNAEGTFSNSDCINILRKALAREYNGSIPKNWLD
jgi:hypothetical protein